ncbi:MAG: hypothetical protein AB7P35_18490, partial [Hyphomonadaceae bacterium]
SRSVAVLVILLCCACAEQPPQQTSSNATNAPAAESFCEEFRAEEVRVRQSESRSFGWPTALPGMAPLERLPAPSEVTVALLGPPCDGGDDLWVVPVARLSGRLDNIEEEFVVVREPSVVALGEGRTAFFAIASEGHYHAADSFGLIVIVDVEHPSPTPLFAMPGSGTWGEAGGFNVPPGQPVIWSAAGDFSFGDAQGWAGVTDVSISDPRAFGRFPTYGRHTCLEADADPGSQCPGAWEYIITSIGYAPDGQLTLTWRLDSFDERSSSEGEPQRLRQTTRAISAVYRSDGITYRRVGGEEPPAL